MEYETIEKCDINKYILTKKTWSLVIVGDNTTDEMGIRGIQSRQ